MNETILIVEDEPSIVTLIQYNINKAGYHTKMAYNGKEALAMVKKEHIDLIVLDLMLPQLDGLEVCKIIRQEQNPVPIIMLTAKNSECDKIHGLELGADDYLTKPFSPKELLARIRSILNRVKQADNKDTSIKVGELKIFPERYQLFIGEKEMTLKKKEFELLLFLMKNKNSVYSRDHLLEEVWDFKFAGDTRIVDVQISNVRDKIELDKKQPKYIKTVRGFGYMLEEPK